MRCDACEEAWRGWWAGKLEGERERRGEKRYMWIQSLFLIRNIFLLQTNPFSSHQNKESGIYFTFSYLFVPSLVLHPILGNGYKLLVDSVVSRLGLAINSDKTESSSILRMVSQFRCSIFNLFILCKFYCSKIDS